MNNIRNLPRLPNS